MSRKWRRSLTNVALTVPIPIAVASDSGRGRVPLRMDPQGRRMSKAKKFRDHTEQCAVLRSVDVITQGECQHFCGVNCWDDCWDGALHADRPGL